MRYRDLIEQTLNEMIVRHKTDASNPLVIAFKDSIWIIDPNGEDEAVLDDIRARTGLDGEDGHDMASNARETRPDILAGYIWGRDLALAGSEMSSPQSSLLIKKVVQQLGLAGVTYNASGHDGDEVEIGLHRTELLGRIPEVVFHGTNTRFIRSILRTGLSPNSEGSNWKDQKLKFPKVFLTTKFDYACFHANSSAAKNNGIAVVIGTRIPDRDLIQLDYDVATQMVADPEVIKQHGYHNDIHKSSEWIRRGAEKVAQHSPKGDWSRETGIFSYTGRIPASFFVSLSLPKGSEDEAHMSPDMHDNWVFTDRASFLTALEMIEDYGFYDPHYRPEDEEDEDY